MFTRDIERDIEFFTKRCAARPQPTPDHWSEVAKLPWGYEAYWERRPHTVEDIGGWLVFGDWLLGHGIITSDDIDETCDREPALQSIVFADIDETRDRGLAIQSIVMFAEWDSMLRYEPGLFSLPTVMEWSGLSARDVLEQHFGIRHLVCASDSDHWRDVDGGELSRHLDALNKGRVPPVIRNPHTKQPLSNPRDEIKILFRQGVPDWRSKVNRLPGGYEAYWEAQRDLESPEDWEMFGDWLFVNGVLTHAEVIGADIQDLISGKAAKFARRLIRVGDTLGPPLLSPGPHVPARGASSRRGRMFSMNG